VNPGLRSGGSNKTAAASSQPLLGASNVASAETGKLRLFGVHFTRREAFVMLLFGLHVISGIAYYARFLETTR